MGKGRPKLEIDPVALKELAAVGLTQSAAAARLGVGLRTLRNRLESDKACRMAWQGGVEHYKRRLDAEKFKNRFPKRGPGRPSKVVLDEMETMTLEARVKLMARINGMLVKRAEQGNVMAMIELLRRLEKGFGH